MRSAHKRANGMLAPFPRPIRTKFSLLVQLFFAQISTMEAAFSQGYYYFAQNQTDKCLFFRRFCCRTPHGVRGLKLAR
jgi:hypothetical protein